VGSISVVSGPATEPVDLAAAKAHLKVDYEDEDQLILDLVRAARDHLEQEYERALVTSSWAYTLDSFPGRQSDPWTWAWPLGAALPIEIPKPPVQSITSITYTDSTNVPHLMVAGTDYVTDLTSTPPRIAPPYGKTWPAVTLQSIAGLVVQFVGGYGTPDLVPNSIKRAILLLVGHLYENREEVVIEERIRIAVQLPYGVQQLMQRHDWRYLVA
jgi:uncharacterized phiE125 gp8 family phage protein